MFYTNLAIYSFENLHNVGVIKNLTHKAIIGSIKQEAIAQLHLVIENDIIKEAKFKAFGNVALIISMDYLCENIIGQSVAQALLFSSEKIITMFDLTSIQTINAIMAIDTLKQAIKSKT